MAVTVPIGIAAPKMLFAESTGKDIPAEGALLLVDDTATALPDTCSAIKKINAASVASVEYKNGSFQLTDKTGKQVRSPKLIFAGEVHLKESFQHCAFAGVPEVTVEFGESKRSAGLLSLTSYHLPQFHVRKKENFKQENLDQFLGKKRAGVLQLV